MNNIFKPGFMLTLNNLTKQFISEPSPKSFICNYKISKYLHLQKGIPSQVRNIFIKKYLTFTSQT